MVVFWEGSCTIGELCCCRTTLKDQSGILEKILGNGHTEQGVPRPGQRWRVTCFACFLQGALERVDVKHREDNEKRCFSARYRISILLSLSVSIDHAIDYCIPFPWMKGKTQPRILVSDSVLASQRQGE